MSAESAGKSKRQNVWLALAVILLVGLGFRLAVARFLANDEPDDGKAYAQLATNLVDHSTFSDDETAPFQPTLIRVPGYPIFLGVIYTFAGDRNNSAVRLVQAVVDTLTCALIGALAFLWMPDERRKRKAGLWAAGFAAVCPFTVIYVATILTETVATFLAVALAVAATMAMKSVSTRAVAWWIAGGLIAGISVLIRPDSGLFAAGVGFTLVLVGLLSRCWPSADVKDGKKEPRPFVFRFTRVLLYGAIFSAAFVLVLVPWTIRNKRTFGVFQPLSPAHAEMPGEFVPRGYYRWLRTWVDNEKYIEPAIWALDDEQITVDKLPASAFDSAEEKARVAALLDQYNNPPPSPDDTPAAPSGPQTLPIPGAPAPQKFLAPQQPPKTNGGAHGGASKNANQASQSGDDENDNSADDDSSPDDQDDSADDSGDEDKPAVEMTPAIDAGFAQIAQERISRSPVRYYFWMPVKRMFALWFGTHSQYYPFAGQLLPWSALDRTTHQQIWLPLFAVLVAIYTIMGKLGGWLLIFKRGGRKWALLVALLCIPRIVFFATLENPEPRYVVELFAFTSVLAGIALAYFWPSKIPKVTPAENAAPPS